jgi:hypothetical protein
MPSRRSFLRGLGGGLLAIAAAPLVVPSRAPVFIPSDRLEMGVPRPIAAAPAIEMPAELRLPALNPHAYFVSGDNGLVRWSTMTWKNVFMQAEDIGLILPLPVTVSEPLIPDDVQLEILEASEKQYGIRAVARDRVWRT